MSENPKYRVESYDEAVGAYVSRHRKLFESRKDAEGYAKTLRSSRVRIVEVRTKKR
jgi:hypothetical protein